MQLKLVAERSKVISDGGQRTGVLASLNRGADFLRLNVPF